MLARRLQASLGFELMPEHSFAARYQAPENPPPKVRVTWWGRFSSTLIIYACRRVRLHRVCAGGGGVLQAYVGSSNMQTDRAAAVQRQILLACRNAAMSCCSCCAAASACAPSAMPGGPSPRAPGLRTPRQSDAAAAQPRPSPAQAPAHAPAPRTPMACRAAIRRASDASRSAGVCRPAASSAYTGADPKSLIPTSSPYPQSNSPVCHGLQNNLLPAGMHPRAEATNAKKRLAAYSRDSMALCSSAQACWQPRLGVRHSLVGKGRARNCAPAHLWQVRQAVQLLQHVHVRLRQQDLCLGGLRSNRMCSRTDAARQRRSWACSPGQRRQARSVLHSIGTMETGPPARPAPAAGARAAAGSARRPRAALPAAGCRCCRSSARPPAAAPRAPPRQCARPGTPAGMLPVTSPRPSARQGKDCLGVAAAIDSDMRTLQACSK